MQKLEEKIFLMIIEDGMTLSSNIYTGGVKKKSNIDNNAIKASNIQRNESLDKFGSLPQSLLVLVVPGLR